MVDISIVASAILSRPFYLVTVAITLWICIATYRVSRKPLSRLPGPYYTKWTNKVLTYHFLRGQRSTYVHSLHQKYGPVVRISPGEVAVADVSAVKKIYNVKETFVKSPWYQKLVPAGFENVFSTGDIELHRKHRRLLSAPQSESSLRTMIHLIEPRFDLAIQRMAEEMNSRGAADIFKWWLFTTTDVIGELTFGSSFRTLDIGQKNQYFIDLEAVAANGGRRAIFPFLVRISNIVPLPFLAQAARSGANMRQYAQESLQRYKRMVDADPNVKPTLFTKVFQAEKEDSLTFHEIVNEAQGYIVAGTDTTANILTYLVWAVCKNNNVRATLVQELSTLSPDCTHDDLCGLPYLSQVIEETLRVYASVPGLLPRSVPPEGAQLCGYWLEGGTTVASQAYTLHRDPIIFPDPERFDPSRWAKPTKEMKELFFAWGGGSRICLGMHLARLELRLGTHHFFKAFPNATVSTSEGMSDEDMEQKIYFLMQPKGKRCLINLH